MESRGIAVLFLLPLRYMLVGGKRHAPTALPPETDPIPTVQEVVRVPGLLWKAH